MSAMPAPNHYQCAHCGKPLPKQDTGRRRQTPVAAAVSAPVVAAMSAAGMPIFAISTLPGLVGRRCHKSPKKLT
jgi:hypothetical protein